MRFGLTALGIVAALVWATLFVQAPGAALEVLLMVSPIVVTAWLIISLTARRPAYRQPKTALQPEVPSPSGAVHVGGGPGPCAFCGAPHVTALVRRLPAARGEERAGHTLLVCADCAKATPLPVRPLR
jgi:hypothetical protein